MIQLNRVISVGIFGPQIRIHQHSQHSLSGLYPFIEPLRAPPISYSEFISLIFCESGTKVSYFRHIPPMHTLPAINHIAHDLPKKSPRQPKPNMLQKQLRRPTNATSRSLHASWFYVERTVRF
jgi:hypothetical protein